MNSKANIFNKTSNEKARSDFFNSRPNIGIVSQVKNDSLTPKTSALDTSFSRKPYLVEDAKSTYLNSYPKSNLRNSYTPVYPNRDLKTHLNTSKTITTSSNNFSTTQTTSYRYSSAFEKQSSSITPISKTVSSQYPNISIQKYSSTKIENKTPILKTTEYRIQPSTNIRIQQLQSKITQNNQKPVISNINPIATPAHSNLSLSNYNITNLSKPKSTTIFNSPNLVSDLRKPINTTTTTEYPVKNYPKPKNKSYCIVFNHENFIGKPNKRRTGTQKDVDAIIDTFKLFNITTEVKHDLRLKNIRNEIHNITYKNFEQYKCLIVFILTHGGTNDILEAADQGYNLYNEIINPITQKNKSLFDKPKLFFVQACKGTENPNIQTDSTCIAPPTNMLLYTSTYEGFVSYRDIYNGGLFIQTLCNQIKKTGHYEKILDLTTKVTKILSEYRENGQTYQQVPTITSTLKEPFCFGNL